MYIYDAGKLQKEGLMNTSKKSNGGNDIWTESWRTTHLNAGAKTTKLWEENIGENLWDTGLDKVFSDKSQKRQIIKEKNAYMDLIVF